VAVFSTYGEPVAGGRVTFTAPGSGASAVLNGSPSTIATDGTASVSVAANTTAGTYSVGAGGAGFANPVQFTLSNVALAASTLAITGLPNPVTAGASNSVTVTAKDPYGNTATTYTGTAHFTSTDGKATLPLDFTFGPEDAGVHTFTSLVLGSSGRQTVTVEAASGPSVAPSTVATWVNPGAMAALKSFLSNPVMAGAPQSFSVRALDPYGNTATGYTGTVRVTSTDSQAMLPPNYTFTASDAGYHDFPVTLETAGSQTVTAKDTAAGIQGGSSTNVQPVAATMLAVSGFPSPATAGVYARYTVAALDPYGNVAPSYRGTIHFTSTSTSANLPANYTFTSTDSGSHTFSASLNTAALQSLRANDTITSSIAGVQNGIAVNPAAASTFILNYPTTTVAGTSQSFSVTAMDAYGNTASGYTGTVRFTSDDSRAVLSASYTYQASDAGTHNFSATLKTAGSKAIRASDTVYSSITGLQSNITVAPAAAQSLAISGLSNPDTAGTSYSFTVTAKDPYGNTATSYIGTVVIGSTDNEATLPPAYAFGAGDAGVHTFTGLVLRTAEAQTVAGYDPANASLVTTAKAWVNPSVATALSVSEFPSTTTAGTSNRFTVRALDAYGNVANGYTGTVHFTTTSPLANLPANYTFQPSDSGARAFTASLNTVGSQTLTATDTDTSSFTGSQSGIAISPGAVSTFAPLNFPSTTTAGTAQPVLVRATDAYGNTVPTYAGTVRFTSDDSRAVLPSDYTYQPSDAGVRAFVVTLTTAGTKALRVTDALHASITRLESGITVNPAYASSLSLTGLANPVTSGATDTFLLTLRDAYGNIATGYTGTVHFTSSDGKATLPSDYTFSAFNAGQQSFAVVLGTVGTQGVTVTSLAAPSFSGTAKTYVNPGAMATLSVYLPSTTTVGVPQTFSLRALDAYGNTATGYSGTVRLASTDSAAVLPPPYTFGPSDAGAHTFVVTLNTPGYPSVMATDEASGIHNSTTTHVVPGVAQFAAPGAGSSPSAPTSASLPNAVPSASQQFASRGGRPRLHHTPPHPRGAAHRRAPRRRRP
jgi:hypothetical protein